MAFWKKLVGIPYASEHRALDTYIESPSSTETRSVEALVNSAQEFYPHGDSEKALALFRKAIKLVGPAPASKAAHECRDINSIGDAFWMAWVCLDSLDRPREETETLLAEARVKSPLTAMRIEEQLAEEQKEAALERQSEEAITILADVSAHDLTRIQDALTSLGAAGAWWDLRDAGIALVKQGKYDLAWQTLNSALMIATPKMGNLPSIYLAMGDLQKARQQHREAASCYLLSCLSTKTNALKRAVEQLRISLKKAGVTGDPTAIRDELLARAGSEDYGVTLARLDRYFSSTEGVEKR